MEDEEFKKRVDRILGEIQRDNRKLHQEIGSLKGSKLGTIAKGAGFALGKLMPKGYRHPDSLVKRPELYISKGFKGRMRPF